MRYERPLGAESVALTWQGQLAVVGEEYLFEEDEDGTMRLWVHNNYRVRITGGGSGM